MRVNRRKRPIIAFSILAVGCATAVDRIAVDAGRLGVGKEALEQSWAAGESTVPIDAHRIVPGEHLVLSKRSFEPGDFPELDTEGFEFVSLEIPRIDEARTFDVVSDPVRVFYSRGSSAFPDLACCSYAVSGQVTAERDANEGFRVEFSVKLAAGPSSSLDAECWGLELQDQGSYQLEDLSELSPWLGGPYAYPHEAVYR